MFFKTFMLFIFFKIKNDFIKNDFKINLIKNNKGTDDRFSSISSNYSENELQNIQSNFGKLKILDLLTDNTNIINKKLNIIDENNHIFNVTFSNNEIKPFSFLKGGLFNDFDFDFDFDFNYDL